MLEVRQDKTVDRDGGGASSANITTSHGTYLHSFIKFVYTATHCILKAYCAILVRLFNFRHQASQRVSPRESTQRRKVELWARNVR
jgi:hypothetical protein